LVAKGNDHIRQQYGNRCAAALLGIKAVFLIDKIIVPKKLVICQAQCNGCP